MEPWISVSTTQDANRANGRDGPARFEAVQLDGFAEGPRFGVWWMPAEREPLGSILCVQPLDDERAAARHTLAAQAWRLAGEGWAVLAVDLFANGDSPGAPGDATLDKWRKDLLRGATLVRQRAHGPNVLWGVRGGALLAADIAIALDQLVDACVFWQPPEDGAQLAESLPASLGLSAPMIAGLHELHMHPPARAGRGRLPAVLFAETDDEAGYTDELSEPVRAMAAKWIEAGYRASVRAMAGPAFWRTRIGRQPLPASLFDATEEFLEGVR